MYDIRQFKPTLYFLVLLGLTGFSMAAEVPALWMFSCSVLGINAWLIKTGRFIPLPRWLANGVTLLAVAYVFQQISVGGGPPLMFVGQFLVLLQLVKLFEQRANRDYAQVIVLSLLLMVAASINTASLLFGIVMIFYLMVSLYCCLIFHLKVEADRAKKALAIPEEKFSPATFRQDQRYLGRSMRRLTGLVAFVSVGLAVFVFLFFPRGAGQGVLGQLQFRPSTALTGFNDRVSFDQINKIKQNDEVAAHVSVWKNERPIEGTETLLLRGYTLDTYGPDPTRSTPKPQWTRSRSAGVQEREISDGSEFNTSLEPGQTLYKQKFLLKPSGTKFLFALAGPIRITVGKQITVRYSPADGSLQTDSVVLPLEYEVTSLNAPCGPDMLKKLERQTLMTLETRNVQSDAKVLAQIRAFTLQPEITGDLAARRPRLRPMYEGDEEIARKIEQYLKANFSYTLDLTDSRKMFEGSDPVVAFLTTVKKGHCEYFASAMTLMCQSIGISARMVVGFKCDEYNVISGQYIVRQSHAHTWVEILTPRGWVSFDPTSGREARVTRTGGVWRSIKHFIDYLEYSWAENVVAYESRDRAQLLSKMDARMTNALYNATDFFTSLQEYRKWIADKTGNTEFWNTSLSILTAVICLMVAVIAGLILWFMIQQRRLRRRAVRIGLEALPLEDQLRLARQLAFYDELTRILYHHGIYRPKHLTPLEFSESLVFLPAEAYETIRRLTNLLYRVRYGSAELNSSRQHRLEEVVARLGTHLAGTRPTS